MLPRTRRTAAALPTIAAATEGRTLAPYLARLNEIRREHPALQYLRNLSLHGSDNDQIMCWSKHHVDASGREDLVIIVVNLDPHYMQHGFVRCPLGAGNGVYQVRDLLDGTVYTWRGEWNYVRFDPDVRQGHILKLEIRK